MKRIRNKLCLIFPNRVTRYILLIRLTTINSTSNILFCYHIYLYRKISKGYLTYKNSSYSSFYALQTKWEPLHDSLNLTKLDYHCVSPIYCIIIWRFGTLQKHLFNKMRMQINVILYESLHGKNENVKLFLAERVYKP